MKSPEGYVQAYKCQAVVEEEHQIIVAQAVINQPPDVEHLVPMLVQTVANCGAKPTNFLADAGYFSEANVCEAMKWGCEPFIPPSRQKHDEEPKPVRDRRCRRERKRRPVECNDARRLAGSTWGTGCLRRMGRAAGDARRPSSR